MACFSSAPSPETISLLCSKPPAESWDSRSKLMSRPTLSSFLPLERKCYQLSVYPSLSEELSALPPILQRENLERNDINSD